MNPFGSVRRQLVALCLASVLALLTVRWYAAAGLDIVTIAWWFCLNALYARALGRRPRRVQRIEGDRMMEYQVLVLATILAAGFAARMCGLLLTSSRPTAWGLQLVVLFYATKYCSSLIDWFYIRPRRDGVIGAPPCRSSGEERWIGVTRNWYRHRVVVTFVCCAAGMSAVGFFAVAVVGDDPRATKVAVAGTFFAAAAAAGAFLDRFDASLKEAGFVWAHGARSAPDHALGQRLVRADNPHGSFLRDVAVEAVVSIPLNAQQRPLTTTPDREPVQNVAGNGAIRKQRYFGCDRECVLVNYQCVWIDDDASRRHQRRRRRLVLGKDVAEDGRWSEGFEDGTQRRR